MASSTHRVALLSSFTLDALPPLVDQALEPDGLELSWHVGPFNQYQQMILDPDSELYRFEPGVVFLAVDAEDLFAELLDIAAGESSARLETAQRRLNAYGETIATLAERLPSATIVVHNLARQRPQPHPLLAYSSPAGIGALIDRANLTLAEQAEGTANLLVLDVAQLVTQDTPGGTFDPRYYYLAKMRLRQTALEALAGWYRRVLLARHGRRKKCIVLDLDNTLWGGIVGEDGIENLQIASDGPGRAYQDFQRVLLSYRATGTVLALNSKNDEALALEAMRDHPEMLLRPESFAAMRINWQDKAVNLQELAAELNLGLDSFVFLDDSPHERERVRRVLPQVTVPDFPADPSELPSFAASLPLFDVLALTDEDRRRSDLYDHERRRREKQQKIGSVETFLKELDIRVSVQLADRFALPRVAQLTQRTNQFNLTTRRYTLSDLQDRQAGTDCWVYAATTADDIGDSGIVGAAVVEAEGSSHARLDTFLMSCRVLGRGIESAFLAGIAQDLRQRGVSELVAEYLPTERNGVCRDFLPTHGFHERETAFVGSVDELADGGPAWVDLTVAIPVGDAGQTSV
jgi:FkbH-like protein